MKNILLPAILLFLAMTPALTQRAFIQRFENLHANTRYFCYYKVAPAPDGGWAVAGCDSATQKIYALRFDSCGDLAWAKELYCQQNIRPYRCADLFFDAAGDLVIGACFLNDIGIFYLIKLAPDGALKWNRSWCANRLGPGVFSMGLLDNERYFFTGTNFVPSGPQDFVGVVDSSGQLRTVRTYFQSTLGYQTLGAALPDGHLLVRRGGVLYKISPLDGAVIWKRSYGAPIFNSCIPLLNTDGYLIIGQFSDTGYLPSAVPLFFTDDGVLVQTGEVFRANGGISSNIKNLEIRRAAMLEDGNFVTVTTDSLPTGYISIVIFSPDGKLLRQTLLNPDTAGTVLLNHDFCLLSNGSLAIAANANGRLILIRTEPVPISLCGTQPHYLSVPYQTNVSQSDFALSVDTFLFEEKNVPFQCLDLDTGPSMVCDNTSDLPNLDSLITGCIGDTLWANAYFPGATAYTWEDGSDSIAVPFQLGQERVATVSIGCRSFQYRFRSILKPDCPCPVRIPNTFTPNGDGQNDLFLPISICGFARYDLSVFNRWGQVVFTAMQPGEGWNGEVNGRPAPIDMYVYVFGFRTNELSAVFQQRSGSLTLLR